MLLHSLDCFIFLRYPLDLYFGTGLILYQTETNKELRIERKWVLVQLNR